MRGLRYCRTFCIAAVFALAAPQARRADAAEAPVAVDAAIVLAADVSRSIDDGEFALERRGYADAIQSQQLIDAISTGPHGAIALAYVEWAGEGEEKVVVDWAVIRNDADARAFAAALTAAPRSFVGRTAIGSAIDFSFALFAESAFETDRRVIDVSGDGTNNQGRLATEARDAAVGAGAVINGLSIFNRKAAAMGGYLGAAHQSAGRHRQLLPRQCDRRPRRFRRADRRFQELRRGDGAEIGQRDRRRAPAWRVKRARTSLQARALEEAAAIGRTDA